ncbi:MAG: hypothetical protein ACXWC1_21080 [Burkholderiales bacterium]
MKRTVIGFALIAILLVWVVVPYVSPPVFGQTAAAQAPHIGEGGLPQFEKDPAWPKVTSKWKMGFGSAVARKEWRDGRLQVAFQGIFTGDEVLPGGGSARHQLVAVVVKAGDLKPN